VCALRRGNWNNQRDEEYPRTGKEQRSAVSFSGGHQDPLHSRKVIGLQERMVVLKSSKESVPSIAQKQQRPYIAGVQLG
jgi:hypothetical protein